MEAKSRVAKMEDEEWEGREVEATEEGVGEVGEKRVEEGEGGGGKTEEIEDKGGKYLEEGEEEKREE